MGRRRLRVNGRASKPEFLGAALAVLFVKRKARRLAMAHVGYVRRTARHKAKAFGDALWQGFLKLFEEALHLTAPRSHVERVRLTRETSDPRRVPESDRR
jgi:hypothetical protein